MLAWAQAKKLGRIGGIRTGAGSTNMSKGGRASMHPATCVSGSGGVKGCPGHMETEIVYRKAGRQGARDEL